MKKGILFGLFVSLAAVVSVRAEDAGKTVYQQKCVMCHGKDGKGNAALSKVFKVDPSAMDLTSKSVQIKKDEDLNGATSKGKGKMPAFAGKLSAKEIAGVTGYVRTLAKAKPAAPEKSVPAPTAPATK
jgi:mono/diheme cytochrome c family protein